MAVPCQARKRPRFLDRPVPLGSAPLVGILLALAILTGLRGPLSGFRSFLGSAGPSDFAQDYFGARALAFGGGAYPMLRPAFARIGLQLPPDDRFDHRSTHPPTAFLLALPFAPLPYPLALACWSWLMLACLPAALWALGLRWSTALLATPAVLLWPPALWSVGFGQLTPLWLLGICLAWRWRGRPRIAAAFIALAALGKFLAGTTLLAFLSHRPRRPATILAFGGVWLLALIGLAVLSPGSIVEYLANGDNAFNEVLRPDNGAYLMVAWRFGGILGLALAGVLIGGVAFRTVRSRNESLVWAGWIWVGVAVLPIAWTFSLLPLLPVLAWMLRGQSVVERTCLFLTLLASTLAGPPTFFAAAVGASIGLAGLGLAMSTLKPDARAG